MARSGGNQGRGRTSAPPIAIDFGVGSMKILQLSSGEPPSLVAAAQLDTPDELQTDPVRRLDFQMQSLPAVIRKGKFRLGRAVASIPAGQLFCKHLQFQRSDAISVHDLAIGSVSEQIGCTPGELVVQTEEVPGAVRGGKAEVICMAASRDLALRLMQAMRSARLTPVGIHSEPMAMLHGFDYMHRRAVDEQSTTLYLDLGRSSTEVVIAHGSQPVFARSVETGGLHLDQAVAKQTEWHLAEASRLRRTMEELSHSPRFAARVSAPASVPLGVGGDAMPEGSADRDERSGEAEPAGHERVDVSGQAQSPGGSNEPTELLADLTEPLEILTDEIAMCLRYHDGMFPSRRIERGIFVGGEASHRALAQSVARALNVPVHVADPFARIGRTGKEPVYGVDLSTAQPGWAVAVGLCMSPTDL